MVSAQDPSLEGFDQGSCSGWFVLLQSSGLLSFFLRAQVLERSGWDSGSDVISSGMRTSFRPQALMSSVLT